MKSLPFIALGAGLVAGVAFTVALQAPPAPAAATPIASVPVAVCPAAVATVDTQLLRQLLAEAVADTHPPADAVVTPPPAPSPERVAASTEALDLVHHALDTGRWTDEDGEQLRRRLRQATPEARREALTRLAAALNAGELRLEADRAF